MKRLVGRIVPFFLLVQFSFTMATTEKGNQADYSIADSLLVYKNLDSKEKIDEYFNKWDIIYDQKMSPSEDNSESPLQNFKKPISKKCILENFKQRIIKKYDEREGENLISTNEQKRQKRLLLLIQCEEVRQQYENSFEYKVAQMKNAERVAYDRNSLLIGILSLPSLLITSWAGGCIIPVAYNYFQFFAAFFTASGFEGMSLVPLYQIPAILGGGTFLTFLCQSLSGYLRDGRPSMQKAVQLFDQFCYTKPSPAQRKTCFLHTFRKFCVFSYLVTASFCTLYVQGRGRNFIKDFYTGAFIRLWAK